MSIVIQKSLLHCACLGPLIALLVRLVNAELGANPVEELTHSTGIWGLRLLMLTLLITPLRYGFASTWPLKFRRMLGLWSFTYICLHLVTFLVFDHSMDLTAILKAIQEQYYIAVGIVAFILLVPLAVTSTDTMRRRLGRRWKHLHRLIYIALSLGLIHFWMLIKSDYNEPLIYTLLALLLVVLRLPVGRSLLHRLITRING